MAQKRRSRNKIGIGGGSIIAATLADSGTDPAFDDAGAPQFIMTNQDATVKLTTVAGETVSLLLLGKVQYRVRPKLVWNTGTTGSTTVWLMY